MKRVRQFVKAICARMTEEDCSFVNAYLSVQEQKLFYKLRVDEQQHSLTVAQLLQARMYKSKEEKQMMIRLGLLHDIGKQYYPIGPIKKSIMVVVHKLTKGKAKRLQQLAMVKCYYNHPEYSCELLEKLGAEGYETAFLDAIREHHTKGKSVSPYTFILQSCDEKA